METKPAVRVVATGFTTAFLGDERTLREFILGDHIRTSLQERGVNSVLYLINDSFDPLTAPQLRIGVNKDQGLIDRFTEYCGRPIAEIPDPYGCHNSYADHHCQALRKRLHALEIYPAVMDSYQAYRGGHYAPFLNILFERYTKLQEELAERFPRYGTQSFYRAQCPNCNCLDVTQIQAVKYPDVWFHCQRCSITTLRSVDDLVGKLGWKLECAVRWNLYGIHTEVFAKSHLEETGTAGIARYASEAYFGGVVPEIVRYGSTSLAKELSGQLLEALPPPVLKQVFLSHPTRDLILNRESLLALCTKSFVRPGKTWIDYVKRELPLDALRHSEWRDADGSPGEVTRAETDLVRFGNRFSHLLYGSGHEVRLPEAPALRGIDSDQLAEVDDLIGYALSVRMSPVREAKPAAQLIHAKLRELGPNPKLYEFLRRLFNQSAGPSLHTVLALLPVAYLSAVRLMLVGPGGTGPAERVPFTVIPGLRRASHSPEDSLRENPLQFYGPVPFGGQAASGGES